MTDSKQEQRDVERDPRPICKCGADERHPQKPSSCIKGHLLPRHQVSMLVGEHSVREWARRASLAVETRRQILSDLGYADPDHAGEDGDAAPAPLALLVTSISRWAVLEDAAYLKVCETGPTTETDRARRCLRILESATDRVYGGLRQLAAVPGAFARKPHTISLSDYLARAGETHEESADEQVEARLPSPPEPTDDEASDTGRSRAPSCDTAERDEPEDPESQTGDES